jgi:hypothetical protein
MVNLVINHKLIARISSKIHERGSSVRFDLHPVFRQFVRGNVPYWCYCSRAALPA